MEQPTKPPLSIKSLNLDMKTLPGRYRWALFVLEGIEDSYRIGHPVQPQSLSGYSTTEIQRIMRKPSLSKEDQHALSEYHKWRLEVLRIEGANELNLRSALRAIGIFDAAIDSATDEEKEEIRLKRETLVYYLRNEFGMDSGDLDRALKNPFGFARWRCQDLAAFSLFWRDPIRTN